MPSHWLQDYPCRGITLIAPSGPSGPTCLVLGFLDHVMSDPLVPVQPALLIIESDSSQESLKIRYACMAPRASAIKEQGFSKAVAVGIEAPQRGSIRSVIAENWVIHQ